ncbi:hypothetical protein GCM10023084_71990 [Streptomyces lacrimifluminis]|uniref:Uncharacterized protein n=1 Tax=Streptomyces lacrimifluminis TaxID=1500077 RepID=A0A917P5I8_9ACTN|nr:hypothetical protein GCM10012282_70070 [Streptomyces lacrimifluminis]
MSLGELLESLGLDALFDCDDLIQLRHTANLTTPRRTHIRLNACPVFSAPVLSASEGGAAGVSPDRGAKVTNRKEAARPAARTVHRKAAGHGSYRTYLDGPTNASRLRAGHRDTVNLHGHRS